MLPPSWQPGIAYYADLGGNDEILIVPDLGASHYISQDQGQTMTQASHPKSLKSIFQSCMFYILKVFKTKTYLCVAILLLLLFLVVSLSLPPNMAYSQTYLVMYQAHKHHYLITPPYTSPYTDTPKRLFWKTRL